ncbi:hypothetical protein NDU88_004318 [Pleurodeles waltl]|uniref:Uncharacterized protein n=1 Tax=Pleurodeles waltl TaxID=8319 RepID=A0AAV7SIG0_PLEWA|nr:hypothetical protein NDU88_004318 [Pleurodeles waltl]
MRDPGSCTGPRTWFPRGAWEREKALLTSVTPELEEDAEGQRWGKRMLEEEVGVLDSEEEGIRPEEGKGVQPNGRSWENKTAEETPDTEPSSEDETTSENANTGHHVLGGTWLLQVQAHLPTLYHFVTGKKGGGEGGL